jgi:hypothetical protein
MRRRSVDEEQPASRRDLDPCYVRAVLAARWLAGGAVMLACRFRTEIEDGGAGLLFAVACGGLGYVIGLSMAVLP